MDRRRSTRGVVRVEVMALLLSVAVLIAAGVPMVQHTGQSFGVQVSMSNLATLGLAHTLYAADWNGRQVTWAVDELGQFDGVSGYDAANGCYSPFDENCHPPLVAGSSCDGNVYGYYSLSAGWAVEPVVFPGAYYPTAAGYGHFRVPNLKAFHDYVNGRYHDRTFYAPRDATVLAGVSACFDTPCEFDPDCNTPGWSSYCLSPAAMLHPDVMRPNAQGGWQSPWTLAHGFESPGLFQARNAALKTHMIEHHWLQGPPAPCNPNFTGCVPYFFNHGLASRPVTLFYDGHVQLLPNQQVAAADQQVLQQTGGVDGLWHRGTSFGDDGYFIPDAFDEAELSHHVLTTDGILGRDIVANR